MVNKKIGVLSIFSLLILISIVCFIPACSAAPITRFDSANSAGDLIDVYSVGDAVYAKAVGLTPGDTYVISVVEDLDEWTDGQLIPASVTTSVTVTDPDGTFLVQVWSSAAPGQYDIVADKNGDGVYNRGVDRVDNDDVGIEVDTAGFLVIPEYALGGLAALGACFTGFVVYKRKTSRA
ncbi:MAG: hypothetical protein ACFCUE_04450 [Candidatus Bathyarchaeia archaeon]|jgi:hypothetical protein